MSFEKAKDLLRLADMAAARHRGVCLNEITAEFGVARRTAQRMTQALAEAFPLSVEVHEDPDRTRRWAMKPNPLSSMALTGADELEALDVALSRLDDPADERQRTALSALRERLLAKLTPAEARRAEADAEALLEAYGMAARPGPVARVETGVVAAISEALRGPFRLLIRYNGSQRLVEPYGVLLGARRYLVARQPNKDETLRHFRLDRIEEAGVTEEWFGRDEGFSLEEHASRAFGSYHNDAQYRDVIWWFDVGAVERAQSWEFHPGQKTRLLEDGGLEVRFRASGWLEMAWHLYQWGDCVEVIAPRELADMVHAARRDDFDALP
ncbi:helix-turn-helix transcriptional regulator [Shimia abyssi]|uniref:Putative DNA-binding transcriptional regulator YafY n=1 Tax=Shimia abyssi TaxID=1662395 RepID=A0A2P8F2V2_9RHOB|nr:WYL domain-containing protein [Shimia abyssi]PSL16045.1 putative DNA-binding transcriptional regulator YafY [Shimia abyssi]